MPTSSLTTARRSRPNCAAGAAISLATACAILAGSASAVFGGDWKYMELAVPHSHESDGAPVFDPVFDEWFGVVGPATFQISAQGELTGDIIGQVQFGNFGQFFFYEQPANSIPDGYGVMNRSGDMFFNTWSREFTLAVETPDSAQQADFAGNWYFAALTAGTILTKTAKDLTTGSEFTLSHNESILHDGSQYLLDIQRSPTSMTEVSLSVDASGSAGAHSLTWQGDGSLALSGVATPLFVNASRDFAFGMSRDEQAGEQELVVGIRKPTNADSSWMVGQWRAGSVLIEGLTRDYFDPSTGQHRMVVIDDDQPGVQSGERLGWARLEWFVDQQLLTIDQQIATFFNVEPDGTFYPEGPDGDVAHLNASGDIIVVGWQSTDEWGHIWSIDVLVKVSDELNPTSLLTLNSEGSGETDVFPVSDPMDDQLADSAPLGTTIYEYINGESVVLLQEAYTIDGFLGWAGDVPAGEEQSEALFFEMNGDRNITASFETAPPDSGGDPYGDDDGDGMPYVLEHLFFDRDPNVAEFRSPLEMQQTTEGHQLTFAVHEHARYGDGWRVSYSNNLQPGSWVPVSEEFVSHQNDPAIPGRVLVIVNLWSNADKTLFFRVEAD